MKNREETKAVSRLTMENMNLASRCRQAISEAAELKRKVVGYEKRHGDFGNLQKEVLGLRRQIERQHGGGGNGGNGGVQHSSSKRNRSTSPKGARRISGGGGGNDGITSTTPIVDETKRKISLSSAAIESLTLETTNSSETTDLDRIMAQELFKKNGGGGAVAATGSAKGVDGSSGNNDLEEKGGSHNSVLKKFQELNISANNKSGGGSNKMASSSTTSTSNATITSSKRSITPTITSSTTTIDSSNISSNISSANTKIPISVTTSSAIQKDDEFDAEIDMVDFFAKKQGNSIGTSSSSSSSAHNNSSDADDLPSSAAHHTRSHLTHKMKKTETDDHMPVELVGSGELLSPSASSSKTNVGDSLLSSLDAFEASFASAFPETSFSIKSEAPSSVTQLDMSFDVPVFDPFFKSPANRDGGTSASLASLQSSPKSKSSLSSSGVAANNGNDHHHKDGMKSQLKDLFPDSALTTSPKRGLDLTFDSSTFPDLDIGGSGGGGGISSNNNKSGGKGKSSLSADKLDMVVCLLSSSRNNTDKGEC